MARTKDLERKPALLDEIVNYLLDKPLSGLTFRTLAEGLSVSTYTLVYHFGTRAELLREIVQAVSERQAQVILAVAREAGDIEDHLVNLRDSWRLSLGERSLQLQRLEFEAAMLESREERTDRITHAVLDRWTLAGVDALCAMGVGRVDAQLESRILVGTIYGLHYDLLVTRDVERTTAAFERAVLHYEHRVRALISGMKQSTHA